MDTNRKGSLLNRILIGISGILILVFFVCIFLAITRSDFSIVNYISITSTFSIALLTVIYVYASTKQMNVMELQLKEMKDEHLLQKQPILLLNQPQFQIEKPNFFYCPPTNQFSFQSRYHFKATLENVTDDPAIVIHVAVKIAIPQDKQELIFDTHTQRLNFYSAKSTPQEISLLFVDDIDGVLYDALRDRKTIKIKAAIYYQNTSGACFSISNTFSYNLTILAHQTNYGECKSSIGMPEILNYNDIVINWHTSIKQAQTKYKEALQFLNRIVRSQEKRSNFEEKFQIVKDDFESMLSYHEDLLCPLFEDSESFLFTTITKDEYNKGTDNSDFIEKHFPQKKPKTDLKNVGRH